MSNPADLNVVPQPDTNKDYFNFKATGLKIDQTYAIKFQWVYSDGTVSDWSPGKFVTTNTESVPSAPTATVTGGAGFIKVELPTFPSNALRVDVRIAGGTFGSGTVVAESFTSAGVKTIAALGAASPGNAYVVTLLTVTPSKINGDPTSATTVYVTDPSAALVVTAPQDPFAPVVKAGLASVIVEWSGKKSDGTDLTVTGFSGAKVHIGTSSGFTPSADNWVHTLNFANGSNRVSIGVGSVIDKTAGTTLQYGTAYYVKLVAVNASGTTSSPVSASNNPVTVARLPASEIDAGILRADAYIQAGADGGQRAVLSGSTSPFIIYGTDGTTKLLEFLTSGTTGTLAIKGSGTFSGDISAASGTFTGNVTTSGNISASNGLFSVNNGILTALSGTIGGWTINSTQLRSSAADGANRSYISFNPATPKIALITGATFASGVPSGGTEAITIDPVSGIVGPNVTIAGNTGPGFSFSPNGTAVIRGTIYADGGIFSGTVQRSSGSNSITLDGTSFRAVGSSASVTIGYDGTVRSLETNNGVVGNNASFRVESPDYASYIGSSGLYMHQNSIFDSSEFDFYQYIWNNTLNYAVTGGGIAWTNYYITAGVSTYTTARITTAVSGGNHDFRPLGLSPDGGQWTGPRLYYGSSTTSSAINAELSGGYGGSSQNGDFYFSTA
jgi:hypothetical protein